MVASIAATVNRYVESTFRIAEPPVFPLSRLRERAGEREEGREGEEIQPANHSKAQAPAIRPRQNLNFPTSAASSAARPSSASA